jgi:hypothetical protein
MCFMVWLVSGDNLQNLQISNSSKSFDTINVPGSHIENYYVPLIIRLTLYIVATFDAFKCMIP